VHLCQRARAELHLQEQNLAGRCWPPLAAPPAARRQLLLLPLLLLLLLLVDTPVLLLLGVLGWARPALRHRQARRH
jgi:hypothetical protein